MPIGCPAAHRRRRVRANRRDAAQIVVGAPLAAPGGAQRHSRHHQSTTMGDLRSPGAASRRREQRPYVMARPAAGEIGCSPVADGDGNR